MRIIEIIKTIISPPHSKRKFLTKINKTGILLDIGCGNNSPYKTKQICPDIYYIGIDIEDYNQTMLNAADEYILTTSENFAESIGNMNILCDAIVSSHNLEHCIDREKVIDGIIKILKPGGDLFLSFPTENSINFPKRNGTLNYYDDSTHKYAPPDFNEINNILNRNNFDVVFSSKAYKPFLYYLFGLFLDPISKMTNSVLLYSLGTWAYWGFEAIIWAKKK